MKKTIKCLTVCLFALFIAFLFASKPVSANYDEKKNNVSITVEKEQVKIRATYQRGLSRESYYIWCEYTGDKGLDNINACSQAEQNAMRKFVQIGGEETTNYINQGRSSYVDENPVSHSFTVNKENDQILNEINNYDGKNFTIFAVTYYCTTRDGVENNYTSCMHWESETTKLDVNIKNLIDGNGGYNVGDLTEDEDVNELIIKIQDITNNTILPIIYVVLGIFLVIKGALLGMQIVKAADEPQLRQEKIGSLKWLVIGVAIAYAATFVVNILTKYLDRIF